MRWQGGGCGEKVLGQFEWLYCVVDSFSTRDLYIRAQSMFSRTRYWMVAWLLCLWTTVSSSVSPSFFAVFHDCIFPSRFTGCTGNSGTRGFMEVCWPSPGPRVNLALRRLLAGVKSVDSPYEIVDLSDADFVLSPAHSIYSRQ